MAIMFALLLAGWLVLGRGAGSPAPVAPDAAVPTENAPAVVSQTNLAAVPAAAPVVSAQYPASSIAARGHALVPAQEPPETVAFDRRGAHMVRPAMGELVTLFHEAGPYWVGGYHQGVDFAAFWDWSVLAAWDGVVVESSDGWNRGYGNMILIDHGNGLQTRYAHMSKRLVEAGDKVKAGQQIGLVGNTGASEGPHLHFEVIADEVLRDPLLYIRESIEY